MLIKNKYNHTPSEFKFLIPKIRQYLLPSQLIKKHTTLIAQTRCWQNKTHQIQLWLGPNKS